jgi:putative tricarboxylic transport membrane protein
VNGAGASRSMTTAATLIVHTPGGTWPEVLARALIDGDAEAAPRARLWELVKRSGDRGREAMDALAAAVGRDDLASTCTPLFLQTPLLTGFPITYRNLTPLARLVSDRYLVVVGNTSAIDSPEAFKAALGDRQTRTGGTMTGSINQLAAIAIEEGLGADVEYELVRSGPDVLTGVLDGRFDWAVATTGELRKLLAEGSVRPIAAVASKRLPQLTEVPSLSELGVNIDITHWQGLMGPPGLSRASREHWDAVIRAAISTDAWRRYESQNGVTTAYLNGDSFGDLLAHESEWYAARFRERPGLRKLAAG